IAYRFEARDVNLVLGPGGAPVPFTVRLDGAAPGDAHGVDVDPSGAGVLDQPRMYQLVRRRGPVGDHLFEITFDGAGARAYVFTFGQSGRDRLSAGARQRLLELAARADAELGEDLVAVPLDGPRAEEQLGADLRVGAAVARQPRDV